MTTTTKTTAATSATKVFAPGSLVHARGREWMVLGGSDQELLRVRPLTGSDADVTVLHRALEREEVREATFPLPTVSQEGGHDDALLLRDALLLSLRRGAGPFRGFGQVGVEPRAYQLVPLLMALKQETVRLLIADDVGVGKTIEAALILRELLDRGEIQRSTILCPPHLVDQWVKELSERFHIPAVAVTAAGARRLERDLPPSVSLFEVHHHTVVSLDYIKRDDRRAAFLEACPEFVVVDEAHACAATAGSHQRYELLRDLAARAVDGAGRHMVLLTATPHSGAQDAFHNLLGLLDPAFLELKDADDATHARLRSKLAEHFVQRRRRDIDAWKEDSAFPLRQSTEITYKLTGEWERFFQDVLNYCGGVVERLSRGEEKRAHIGLFATLALMRCVASSPFAAVSALRSRAGIDDDTTRDDLMARIFDGDGANLTDDDVEPATLDDPGLAALIAQAEALTKSAKDPKLALLLQHLEQLLDDGFNPVVFCRYISTAHYLHHRLREHFKKKLKEQAELVIDVVTGELPNEARRAVVEKMDLEIPRILIATDCLSEGINLQHQFNAVVHYDLSWNPTRHEQREGRVDRYGQASGVRDENNRPLVRCTLMYGDNPVDGAVLEVILKKAERIREELGVPVPLPDDGRTVTAALLKAVLLKGEGLRTTGKAAQGAFDFMQLDPAIEMEARWKSAMDQAKRVRTVFAQASIKTDAVLAEYSKTLEAVGSSDDVKRFTTRSLARFQAPLDAIKNKKHDRTAYRAHLNLLPQEMRERLAEEGLDDDDIRIAFDHPAPRGCRPVQRSHPLVAVLAETLLGRSLTDDVGAAADDRAVLGRVGAWQAAGVSAVTTVVLLRLRHQLAFKHPRREASFLVVEEASALVFVGDRVDPVDADAFQLLKNDPLDDVPPAVKTKRLSSALSLMPARLPALQAHASTRAAMLLRDHLSVKKESHAKGTTTVSTIGEPDVIGLFVLFPSD
jgi:superfamily II DNA or RNA helicase